MKQIRELSSGLRVAYRGPSVSSRVDHFKGWLDRAASSDADVTTVNTYDHTVTVQEYYDLCTPFMIFGWGESLHFAPLASGESVADAQVRHQRLMIAKLGLQEGMTVVDIGCGIGGPMRRVVRESGVKMVGINSSEVQLNRARSLNAEAELDHMIDLMKCSFMDMSAIADETFDRGYAIEATCHAPDKVGAFAEIYRVLKPGALFWGQEMCLTDKFDPKNSQHQEIKRDLMYGIALKDIATINQVNQALETVGFEVIEGADRAVSNGGNGGLVGNGGNGGSGGSGLVGNGGNGGSGSARPWYQPMEGSGNRLGNAMRRTPLGRKAYLGVSRLAESLRVWPKGTGDVVILLHGAAHAYVAGGKTGIFTPLYCFLARKPD